MYLDILSILLCLLDFLLINIEDACFSDHKPIVFNVPLSSSLSIARTPDYYFHYFNSSTANMLAECYQRNATRTSISTSAELLSSPDEFISLFDSFCSAMLDSIHHISHHISMFQTQTPTVVG